MLLRDTTIIIISIQYSIIQETNYSIIIIIQYSNSATNNKITKQELEHRPVLVIRWDAHHSPAPGTGMIGTQLAKFQGEALALVTTLIDWFS